MLSLVKDIRQERTLMSFNTNFTPKAGESRYTMSNLDSGDAVKLRFVSNVIDGFSLWEEENGKPKVFRKKEESEIDKSKAGSYQGTPNKIKQFIAAVVWNYTAERFEIFETDKASIIKKLWEMDQDEDLGNLTSYDIKVSKSGSGMETRYSVMPLGISPVSTEILEAYEELSVDLTALYRDENPFDSETAGEDIDV